MRAKICGITNLADANLAVKHGAWALGFNFYKQSPRYIEPSMAKLIIQELPSDVLKVGIVIGREVSEFSGLKSSVGLDLLQVYETLDAPADLKKYLILSIQAMSVLDLASHDELVQYGYLLLDAPKSDDGLMGGTGRLSNWRLAAELAKKYRLILAGGLTPNTIIEAMNIVKPYAVDVASGVQCSPGKLDAQLTQDFLRKVNDEE